MADSYEFGPGLLAGMADSVASVVASQVVPVRQAPGTSWKPPKMLWVYLALLAVTAVLAVRKQTSWLSLVGVAILPRYFIWVLLDAYRSALAGTPQAGAAALEGSAGAMKTKKAKESKKGVVGAALARLRVPGRAGGGCVPQGGVPDSGCVPPGGARDPVCLPRLRRAERSP